MQLHLRQTYSLLQIGPFLKSKIPWEFGNSSRSLSWGVIDIFPLEAEPGDENSHASALLGNPLRRSLDRVGVRAKQGCGPGSILTSFSLRPQWALGSSLHHGFIPSWGREPDCSGPLAAVWWMGAWPGKQRGRDAPTLMRPNPQEPCKVVKEVVLIPSWPH